VAVIQMYIAAGLTHLALVVTNNRRAPFFQTLRGYCYANSPQILAMIPIVGGIAYLYTVVVQIIMVMKVHRASGGVATFAVLWWLLLLCGLGMAAGFGLLALGVAAQ
jgi:hypothetical protein